MKDFKIFLSFVFAVLLILGLSISFQSLLAAWTAPLANPPACVTGNPGCDAPINTSTSAQTTDGTLWIVNKDNGNPLYGLIVEQGKVGIGTNALNLTQLVAQLQVTAPTGTEGLRIISASNYSPLNIRNNANDADIFRVDQTGILQVGSVPWARLANFPTACASGKFVTAVGAALSCDNPPSESGDAIVGNEVTDAANATLIRSGAGSVANPYKLALNLANANAWTAAQTINAGTGTVLEIAGGGDLTIKAQTSGANSIFYNDTGTLVLTTPLSVSGGITSSGKNVCLEDGTNCQAAADEADPVWTLASANYYTKTNLQTSGGAQVHWDNIASEPSYVLKAGDTMSGNLTINSGTNTSLTIAGGGDLTITHQTSGADSIFYNDTGTLVLTTPLSVEGEIKSSGKLVCLADGTNCQAVSTPTLQAVTDQGATTNKTIIITGLTTSGAGNLNIATNVIKAQGTATEIAVNYGGTAKGFTVYDNTTSLFRVDSAGDVSIAQKLTVSGNIELAADKTIDGVDLSDYSDYFIDSAGTSGQVWKSDGSGRGAWASDSHSEYLLTDGTRSMTGDLTIEKATPVINLKRVTSGNPELKLTDATSHWGIYNATGDSSKLKFWYGDDRLIIDTSGNVSAPNGEVRAKWLHATSATGDNTFAGKVLVDNYLTATELSLSGGSSFSYDLDVTGDGHFTGNLTVDGDLILAGQDLAEGFDVLGGAEAGDVLVIAENNKLKKSDKPYDKLAAGVVSTKPAIKLGEEAGVQVALSGTTPVKVTNENGAIAAGDLLTTSSLSGYAMKCSEPDKCFGATIGKALEDFSGQTGVIKMLISLQ